VATAREHLAVHGAAGLSLRAVARDLGMASSAVYRYFPSRDDLLTALIIDGYNGLGEAAEAAEAAVRRNDLRGRFRAVCGAVRRWALDHPHEYALLYGSPVPGYAAPQDTVAPAVRVSAVLITVLLDGFATGQLTGQLGAPLPRRQRGALAPVRDWVPADVVPDELMVRGLMVWTELFGMVSFELFGHIHQVIGEEPGDRDAYFHAQVERMAAFVGVG